MISGLLARDCGIAGSKRLVVEVEASAEVAVREALCPETATLSVSFAALEGTTGTVCEDTWDDESRRGLSDVEDKRAFGAAWSKPKVGQGSIADLALMKAEKVGPSGPRGPSRNTGMCWPTTFFRTYMCFACDCRNSIRRSVVSANYEAGSVLGDFEELVGRLPAHKCWGTWSFQRRLVWQLFRYLL